MKPEIPDGWTVLFHPAFQASFDRLTGEVTALKAADPATWKDHPKAKLLERIRRIVFEEIPAAPDAPEFLQGNTLGQTNRRWRRVKFLQRFRLFFRFDSASKVIVIAWVNDENTLRKAGAKTDPYRVFARQLARGDPPSDWSDLLAKVKLPASAEAPDAADD
jgi:toxin YhaV